VKPFVGKNLTFEQLLAIRTAITNFYTSKGYTTSGAFLPPQNISSGAIKVQVIEGELERVQIKGLKHLKNIYVRSRLEAAAKTPVNIRRLEAALQLLQQDPLLRRVQAELTAGTTPGRNVLIVNLKEAQPLSSALIVDNREPPSVGSLHGTALLSHNNLLGLGDRLDAEFGLTQGVSSYNLNYELPVNDARDGRVNIRYSNGRNRVVEQPFAPLNIKGRSQTYSVGFRQPLIRTPSSEFALGLAVDLRHSQTFLLENEPFSFTPGPEDGESKVRVIRFSQDWVNRSSSSVLAARSQFSFGLGVLGATVNNTGTDGRFVGWLGQFQWLQALNESKDAAFVVRAAAQLTGDSLLPLEQFSIGGINSVRGYRTDWAVGDNGIIGSVEVRLPIVRERNGFGLLQVVPFIDAGTVWSNSNETFPDSNTLVSTGLGLWWQLNNSLSARLDWGIPLVPVERRGDSLQDNGISFSIQMQPF
jgi:hemolysin activation/secretion protein